MLGPSIREGRVKWGYLGGAGCIARGVIREPQERPAETQHHLASMEEARDCVESSLGYTDEEETCGEGGGSGLKP